MVFNLCPNPVLTRVSEEVREAFGGLTMSGAVVRLHRHKSKPEMLVTCLLCGVRWGPCRSDQGAIKHYETAHWRT